MSDNYFYPKELKKLRACTGCGMIKSESQVKFKTIKNNNNTDFIFKLLTND